MNLTSVMSQLKGLGTSQQARACQLQGAGDDVYGVSMADLRKLTKQIGEDHELAVQLWQTGNTDARLLATMIADPEQLTPAEATQWMKDVTYPPHGEGVAGVVARAPFGLSKMRQWRKQKSEYARTTGYEILASILEDDPDSVEETEGRRILKDIAAEIRRSPGRARHAMVMAVIAIGTCKPELREAALETGDLIGDLQSDHPEAADATPSITLRLQRTSQNRKGSRPRVRS